MQVAPSYASGVNDELSDPVAHLTQYSHTRRIMFGVERWMYGREVAARPLLHHLVEFTAASQRDARPAHGTDASIWNIFKSTVSAIRATRFFGK